MQQSQSAKLVAVSAKPSDGLILRTIDVSSKFDDARTRPLPKIRALHCRSRTRTHRGHRRWLRHAEQVFQLTCSSSRRHRRDRPESGETVGTLAALVSEPEWNQGHERCTVSIEKHAEPAPRLFIRDARRANLRSNEEYDQEHTMTNIHRRTFLTAAGITALVPRGTASALSDSPSVRPQVTGNGRMDLLSRIRLGNVALGHHVRRHARSDRPGQGGKHLRQHSESHRCSRLQLRRTSAQEDCDSVPGNPFDRFLLRRCRRIPLCHGAEGNSPGKLAFPEDENRRQRRAEDYGSAGSRLQVSE